MQTINALAYFAEREKELSQLLYNGMIESDTNLIENTIRPIALGRNNYLFAGSHDAAQNAAIIYSFIATCKLHDVNPYEWLKHVLTVMPTFPASRLKDLLPQNWSQLVTKPKFTNYIKEQTALVHNRTIAAIETKFINQNSLKAIGTYL